MTRSPLSRVAFLAFIPLLTTCGSLLDLCPPVDGRVGFFSRGDCVFTRGSFFAGHEWITYFGNQTNDEVDRFNEDEIGSIVEGNRRTDFPKEMLVHLNTSVLAYATAVAEYQDRPENQRVHFLLRADNFTPAAKDEAEDLMREKSREAVRLWATERERSLTLMGQVCHTLQDSFSPAHSVRDMTTANRCIHVMKAYVTRADGFENDRFGEPVLFHGGKEETNIGHTTTEDSIYRKGRDCHTPRTAEEVRACLDGFALDAVTATSDYLRMMRTLVGTGATQAEVDVAIQAFFDQHTALCPEET